MYNTSVRTMLHYHLNQYALRDVNFPSAYDYLLMKQSHDFIKLYFPKRNSGLVFVTHDDYSMKHRRYN